MIVPSIQSRSLSGRYVSTGFLDPVLGAMMKQVCRQLFLPHGLKVLTMFRASQLDGLDCEPCASTE